MGKYKKNNKQLNTLGNREKLTEAPDDLGFLTDDEIEEQERQEFEKRLAQRKAHRDIAKSKELRRQEQEKKKEQARKEAEAKGKELYEQVKNLPFEDWFDILVPRSGEAPTVAGEIVRAVNTLAYRYWNDGDKFYEGYGRETCGSSAAYLYEIEPFYELLTDMIEMNGRAYDEATNKLCDIAQDYLLDTPELFGEINEHDSRSDREYDINAISEFDEPHDFEYTVHLEDYVNDNLDICLADFVTNGYVDSFEIIDRLEEDANAECNTYNEIHCDRPSTHSDTDYTFVDLTGEQYETIRRFMSRMDYFDSYIEELYDEFGDPNATEDEYEDEEESLKESKNDIPEKANLKKILDRYEHNGKFAKQGNWKIARGGYDLAFQLLYDDLALIDGIRSVWDDNTILELDVKTYGANNEYSTNDLANYICQVYTDCKLEDNLKEGLDDYANRWEKKARDQASETTTITKYYVDGYYDNKYRGLANSEVFDDGDEAREYVWELLQKGNYVKVNGYHRLNPDDVQEPEDIPLEWFMENLQEYTVKQGNKWVNKGNTGKTHGEFKTKKQADAQRKAMFVNKKKNSNWGK